MNTDKDKKQNKKIVPTQGITNNQLAAGVDSNKIVRMPTNNKLVMQNLMWNEDGDAYLLIKLLQGRYLYDHASKDWFYWNEHYWRLDKLNHSLNMIKELIDLYGDQKVFELFSLEQKVNDGDEKGKKRHEYNIKQLDERINQLSGITRKQRILTLASTGLNSLGITGEEWDKHPMLLSCRNGTIDLEVGEFRQGEQSDYLRTISQVDWISHKTPCPTWETFISQMLGDDKEVVEYVQRLLGYGITGKTIEHIFPIFWGPDGRNGKSTLFNMLKYVLGEFAYKVPKSYMMDQGVSSNNSGSPDAITAGFWGKRIAWSAETNEKDRLDVAKLKELVGGDTMSARMPYAKRTTEFDPSHLFLAITNKRPKAPSNDPALWQRVHLIALTNRFLDNPDINKPNEFKANKQLKNQLKMEASGILAWLVKGCLLWQEYGLNPPDSVKASTEEYQKNEDIIGHFILECCFTTMDSIVKTQPKELYSAYKLWCEDVGHHNMSKKNFLADINTRFDRTKSMGVRYYKNIGLVD